MTTNTPTEFSDRLRYEPARAGHAADLAEAMVDGRVYEHIPGQHPENVDDLAQAESGPPPHREGETWWTFAVFEKDTGRGVGQVEASILGDRAEVAYLFGVAHWDQGYGTEALGWLHTRLKQQHPEVRTLWACITPPNDRSRRVAEKLGYQLWDGEYPELWHYDPGDWVYRHDLEPAE
ncbi:MAG: GNAT family N-acetyltransferase [Planctomycetota bacterium]